MPKAQAHADIEVLRDIPIPHGLLTQLRARPALFALAAKIDPVPLGALLVRGSDHLEPDAKPEIDADLEDARTPRSAEPS